MGETEEGLPKGWECSLLGDILFTTSGGTPSRKHPEYYSGSIPWVKSGELDKGIIYKTEENISESAVNTSSAKVFPKGTLLVALYGATIGKIGILGIDAATNQAICGIFKNEFIDTKYLQYFLFSKRRYLVEQSAGGAQPNISQAVIRNTPIPLPPLAEQERIVAKIEELFSSLDAGVASLKTAQGQLKVYRQAVLKWAFEGKLTAAWREERGDKRKRVHTEGTVNTVEEGELPEGWRWEAIGKLCDCIVPNRDKPKSFNGEIKWVTTSSLSENSIHIDFQIFHLDYQNKKLKNIMRK
jgi:type I restriction enzyme S subunit